MSLPLGAIVRIVENDAPSGAPVIADRVLINDTDVGLLRSFHLAIGTKGDGTATVLTLELYPRLVIVGAGYP